MPRLCSRPGCSGRAAATFTFDGSRRLVWLANPTEGAARAGDLCVRHAGALVPPRGWEVRDLRAVPATTRAPEPDARTQPAPSVPAAAAATEGPERLGVLLDAKTPLLARAFRASGA